MHTARRLTARGFTLIELLVVIAIIAILAAILFPVFARARENARRSSCQSNLKQIALGFAQYTQDYDEFYPWGWDRTTAPGTWPGYNTSASEPVLWPAKLQPYLKSKQIFKCPSIERSGLGHHCNSFNYQSRFRWETDTVYPDALYVAYGYNTWGLGGGVSYGLECDHVFAPTGNLTDPTNCFTCQPAHHAKIESPATMLMLVDNNVMNGGASGVPAFAQIMSVADAGGDLNCRNDNVTFDPYDGFDGRHFGGMNVAFVDGHVKWLKKKDVLYRPPNWNGSCYEATWNSTDPRYLWNRM